MTPNNKIYYQSFEEDCENVLGGTLIGTEHKKVYSQKKKLIIAEL